MGLLIKISIFSINPNPCVLQPGQALCTVNVSWQSPALSQIWIKMDRQPEKLFACGTSKTQTATWIQKNHTYQFNMYSTSTCDATEAHTTPTASASTTAINPSVTINPNPCVLQPGQVLCTVNVSWQSPVLSQIWVKMDNQPEKLFACGMSKTQTASWIQKNHTYQFNMYTATACSIGSESHTTAIASGSTTAI